MKKLGPCPFCGNIPHECSFETRWQFTRAVLCDTYNCGAIGPRVEVNGNDYNECEQRARDAWNSRTIQMRVDARHENLP